jgi:hypothetical protein
MQRRVYRGLSRREHAGWILGLTPLQALVCVVVSVPVLWAMSAGRFGNALGLGALAGAVAIGVALPIRGRPAARWVWHLARHQLGVATGWSTWQSRAAAGEPVDPDEPDLPGVLARLRFPDGPPFGVRGRVCLIHDTRDGRWSATARLAHRGVGMLSQEQCERLASRLGNLLLSIGHRDVIDRISLMVRTVPDDGSEYAAWRATHDDPNAPALAKQAVDELDTTVGSVSVRHEVFVTVSGREDALRKPAAAAGGGTAGRGHALYRALEGLEDPLKALGANEITWLSGHQLAAVIRTGFNPAASAALHHGTALPKAAAGPTSAPSPQARSYSHDGFTTVSYSVLMPEAGTLFGSLAPLLAVSAGGERRTLAVHYEVLDARRAARTVRGNRFRANVVRDTRASRGFAANAAEQRENAGARAQEAAVAAGHAIVRFAAVSSVTVPTGVDIEDRAARLENDASGRFRLLRLELAQDSAFVAACLPVGIGLPRMRGELW